MKNIAQKIEDRVFSGAYFTTDKGTDLRKMLMRIAIRYRVSKSDEGDTVETFIMSDESEVFFVNDIWGTLESLAAGAR